MNSTIIETHMKHISPLENVFKTPRIFQPLVALVYMPSQHLAKVMNRP